MPVIAVINRKGGSGKSTLATHLAACYARRGHAVMLGDSDRQQSSRGWLRRRNPALPAIQPWTIDHRQALRAPPGVSHVILDTPGGLHGLELARVVMGADLILMPVAPSVFDRESAAECLAELQSMPRVSGGRCPVAAIGMRVDRRTHGAQTLQTWAENLRLPLVGVLRETQIYVRALERGLTMFDLTPSQVRPDLDEWEPITRWVEEQLAPAGRPVIREPAPMTAAPLPPTTDAGWTPAAVPAATAPVAAFPAVPGPDLNGFQKPRPSILDQARIQRQSLPPRPPVLGGRPLRDPGVRPAGPDLRREGEREPPGLADVPLFLRPRLTPP